MPKFKPSNHNPLRWMALMLLGAPFLWAACGGGGGDAAGPAGEPAPGVAPAAWESTLVVQLAEAGLLSPRITARADTSGDVHLAYFSPSEADDEAFDINYLVWGSGHAAAPAAAGTETVIAVDNCRTLALALDGVDIPFVAYQGGALRECGVEQQSDAMLSVREGGVWAEYTAAIGTVERNPVFTDGLAGTQVSAAVDDQGDVHLCYQFFYEGCDSMNFTYPDLCYVRQTPGDADPAVEETVEGNQYGDLNVQNDVGDHCQLVLDHQQNPAVFYAARLSDGSTGLRVARRRDGNWEKQWIAVDCTVGAVSAARAENGGELGVAFYVLESSDGSGEHHCLRYARETDNGWQVETVDDSVWGGDYAALAFDSQGRAAIAYYAIRTHSGYALNDLRLAVFNGLAWERETVAAGGDVGRYNSLWFDALDAPGVCSYSASSNAVYIYRPVGVK